MKSITALAVLIGLGTTAVADEIQYLPPGPKSAFTDAENAPKSASIGSDESNSGRTRPPAYYLEDDVQYFPVGPEFRLSREAQAIEEAKLKQALEESNAAAVDESHDAGLPHWPFLMSEKAREIERNLGLDVAEDEHRNRIEVGFTVDGNVGATLQLTLVDEDRGIHVENLTLPVTLLLRPRTGGTAAFATWSVKRLDAFKLRLDLRPERRAARTNTTRN